MSAAVFTSSEARLRATRKYVKNNPDKIKTICKAYYDNNSELINHKKREKYALMTPEQKKLKQDKEYAKQRDKQKALRLAAKLEKKLLLEQMK